MSSVRPENGPLEVFDASQDHFLRLGLESGVDLDRDLLETNYLDRSVRVHPDKFANDGEEVKRNAMEHASALNVAYRCLRDPVGRAEYLVKLGGIDLNSSDPQGGAPKPSQAFLIEMIERREAVEAAVDEGGEAVEDLRDEVEDEAGQVLARAQARLRNGDVAGAAVELITRRYLSRLIEELEARIEEGGDE
jgi:molecular chaperone HscB